MDHSNYEVVIIGGGVCGTALLYTLSNYTNVKRIALIEKEADVALINSYTSSNSQTLHFGDIETNYTLAKAEKVNAGATLVKNYLLTRDREQNIHTKYHKMVLGVGTKQVNQLKERYQKFKSLFPDLRLLERDEMMAKEPKLFAQRDETEDIIALFTEEGYTVDFNRLAQSFVDNSLTDAATEIDLLFNTKVQQITKHNDLYQIKTKDKTIQGKVVLVAAGAHSLLFAKSLGYGLDYALLSVAGSFYFAPDQA